MKLEFSRHVFGKVLKYEIHENPSCGGRVVTCGRTDGRTHMTKLIVALHHFAYAPKMGCADVKLDYTDSGWSLLAGCCEKGNEPSGCLRSVHSTANVLTS